jgi:hypothetical protein
MGNDGGVIAVQRKFMRHANPKAKSEKADQEELRVLKSQTCALSEEPLQEPIVACQLGNLYNKVALLERLLARTLPEKFQHITSLKDIVTCKFSTKPTNNSSGTHTGNDGVKYYCPITMIEFNGKHPFVVMSSCGCVLSERAIKEVESKECLVCGGTSHAEEENGKKEKQKKNSTMLTEKNILLFLSEEKYIEKQKQILEQKTLAKVLKKSNNNQQIATDDTEEKSNKKKKEKNGGTKRKYGDSTTSTTSNGDSSFKSKKITKDVNTNVAKEKEKNAVFASLFTSKEEKKKNANDLLMTVSGLRYTLS